MSCERGHLDTNYHNTYCTCECSFWKQNKYIQLHKMAEEWGKHSNTTSKDPTLFSFE